MANIKDFIKKIGNETVSLEEQQRALAAVEKTIVEAKAKREESIGKNVDLVISALKKIESDLEAKLVELNNTPAKQGVAGPKGEKGRDGRDGTDGYKGQDGKDGVDGQDGKDGSNGISVTDAKVDFDGSLVITLSDGREIDAGTVVSLDVAKNIHSVQTGGTGSTSQAVLDAIAAIQATIATYGTMAEQNANAVAITGGTITGVTVSGYVPYTGATTAVDLNAKSLTNVSNLGINTTTVPTILMRAVGDNNSSSRIAMRGYSSNTSSSAIRVTKFRGTVAAPQAPQSGDSLGKFELAGYGTTSSEGYPQASLEGLATEAWGATARGTKAVIKVTPNTTITQVTALTIDQDSAATFAGNLSVAGTSTLGTTSTTYVTVTGDASYPMIKATGGTNTPLVLSPLGTGALQAQKTDSTTTGGNARGSYATDLQRTRNAAGQVASGYGSVLVGGEANTSSGYDGVVIGGATNTANGLYSFVGGGYLNTGGGSTGGTVVNGYGNNANGFWNFIGNGYTNTGTSASAVTTQSGTMNATTAVTLSGSNANIKVGQLISGTSINNFPHTYVAAISGTSLTLSQVASGSSTSTLSFYTPHGVVVGGGNNQATGSYSFIGGGGDAGTAANRNVASGDWSTVAGGIKNTASGVYSFVGGGATNSAVGVGSTIAGGGAYGSSVSLTSQNSINSNGTSSFIGAGIGNSISNAYAVVGSGANNIANGQFSGILAGGWGTTRSIDGYHAFPACYQPITGSSGVSQAALLVLGRQTTDATATALTSNSSAAGTTNQVILPNNSAYFFTGEVVSGVTGGGDTKGWTIEGVIKRGAGVATAALVGTPTVVSTYADVGAATWALAVTADTTNGGLKVTFTGQASTTIRTVCQIRTTEMTY